MLRLILPASCIILTINASKLHTICSGHDQFPVDIIESLKSIDGFSGFVPSVYFFGGSTKFVSSTRTNIDSVSLCVDGDTSYSGKIMLFDDGSNGDDVAGDGLFSRSCIYLCNDVVDLVDYWGLAMEKKLEGAHIIVVDSDVENEIPLEKITKPFTSDATILSTLHSRFLQGDKLLNPTASPSTSLPPTSNTTNPDNILDQILYYGELTIWFFFYPFYECK